MRSLARRLWSAGSGSTVTFCESCGQVCTQTCRALAQRDRDRIAVLRLGLPR
ncbi:MAG TPA: hypothetical protein VFP72_24530 [Kineosporiaceae bacterium]|nr:hypothetical protein [Kineosporiaceae bacterium]